MRRLVPLLALCAACAEPVVGFPLGGEGGGGGGINPGTGGSGGGAGGGSIVPCPSGRMCNGVCLTDNQCCADLECPPVTAACAENRCVNRVCTLVNRDAAICSDGLACTVGDHCAMGICTGISLCTQPPAECRMLADCDNGVQCTYVPKPTGSMCSDDGNLCTTDSCGADGGCMHERLADLRCLQPPGSCYAPAGVCVPDGGCDYTFLGRDAGCTSDGGRCTQLGNNQCGTNPECNGFIVTDDAGQSATCASGLGPCVPTTSSDGTAATDRYNAGQVRACFKVDGVYTWVDRDTVTCGAAAHCTYVCSPRAPSAAALPYAAYCTDAGLWSSTLANAANVDGCSFPPFDVGPPDDSAYTCP